MTSQAFTDRLPVDAGLNFSAMTFSRVGELISEMIDHLPSNMTAEQQSIVKQISRGSGPTVLSVYADHDSLRLIHRGDSDFPFSMTQLLSLNAITGINSGADLNEVFGEGFEAQLEDQVDSKLKFRFENRIEERIERKRD